MISVVSLSSTKPRAIRTEGPQQWGAQLSQLRLKGNGTPAGPRAPGFSSVFFQQFRRVNPCSCLTGTAAQQGVVTIYATALWIAHSFWWGDLKKRCFLVLTNIPLLGNPLSSTLNHFSSRNKTDRYKLHSNEVLLTFPVGQNDTGKFATRWFYQRQDFTSHRISEKGFGRTLSGGRAVKGSLAPAPCPHPALLNSLLCASWQGEVFFFCSVSSTKKINVHALQKMKT